MKTHRINTGLYEVTAKGRTFHVEDHYRASDGDAGGWMLYEIVGENGTREWWNDFTTKRSAVAAISAALA